MNLETALTAFVTACRAEGLAPRTVRWYEDIIQQYARATPAPWPPTTASLRQYLADLAARPSTTRPDRVISAASVRAHARALKRFVAWLHAEELIATNPGARLKLPKLPKRSPKGVEIADVNAMLAIANTRDRALLRTLIDTGCRAAEICGLRLADVDLNNGEANVIGKGNKERTVYLTQPTCAAITLWLRIRPPDQGAALFIGTRGPLTPGGLLQVLRRLAQAAHVNGRWNPHAFRHGHAREYLLNGGDLASLSAMLGHEDIQTTQIYTCFTNGELRRQHNRYSPGNFLAKTEESDLKEGTKPQGNLNV